MRLVPYENVQLSNNKLTILVNLDPLETPIAFPQLFHTVVFEKIYRAYLYGNPRKAHQQWGMATNVLRKTVVMVKAWEMMYNAVVHTVLLYGGNYEGSGRVPPLVSPEDIRNVRS